MAPPDFGRSVNPIHGGLYRDLHALSLGGADYAHQIILAPPDFQTFIRPCNSHRVDVTESSSAQLSIFFSIFDHMGSKGNFLNFAQIYYFWALVLTKKSLHLFLLCCVHTKNMHYMKMILFFWYFWGGQNRLHLWFFGFDCKSIRTLRSVLLYLFCSFSTENKQ